MAVALRAYTQGTTQASGAVSIAWPTGTAAGDLAILVARQHHDHWGHAHWHYNTGPAVKTGWTAYGEGVWTKKLTAADIASPLDVNGKITFLQTFTGAARIGNVRWDCGARMTVAGAGVFVNAWGPQREVTIDPGATNRLGNQIRLITNDRPFAVWFRAGTATGWLGLTDHEPDCTYVAYEVVPMQAPNAPVVVTPTPSFNHDNTTPVSFSWLHQSNTNSEQEAVQIRIRVAGGGTWSYVQTAGTITTTVTTMTQTAQNASINSGVLTNGQLYEFQIATQEFGTLGAFSALQYFTPVVKPSVTSITPSSTAESLTPTVAWTATMGVGSQEAWQVRVSPSTDANSETPIWDSGITTGTATSTVAPATAGWTNGQTLYAWVRVLQTGGLWSPWTQDNATFTVSWTAPVAPTSVTVANVSEAPLQVTVNGITAGLDMYLEMSSDLGITWASVQNLINPGTPAVIDMPLAGYGVDVKFRARTSSTISNVVIYSSWTESSVIASTDDNAYLVSEDGDFFLFVRIVSDESHTINQGISITYGHGATKARQDQTVAMGESGSTTLQAQTIDEENEIRNWLTTRGTWWLRWTPDRGNGLTDKPATLMALAAPIGVSRIAQFNTAYRNITFAWVEQ